MQHHVDVFRVNVDFMVLNLKHTSPFKVTDHVGDTAGRSVLVVVVDESCSPSLDFFQLVKISGFVGVPCGRCVA